MSRAGRLENKIAIITGGTSGIGEATAELFVSEGAVVIITGRSEHKGTAIAERLGENAVYIRSDVTQEADIKAVIDQTVERFAGLMCCSIMPGAPPDTILKALHQQPLTMLCNCCLAALQ